ncbi:MAG: protein-L-isoaspartate O-methyltransferase [Nitrososphaerota archaeon]|jgi:protein-L-isoaspartate(D-aspartate) O-methyltransferase|nr:protein-L-isoaspartate O-methyltransferase [Nitrososphaerota archaeon]MDG6931530.1 protein-L-isoaspartate O-methyltransferase [Nitrososphaerota archaeon]MDG6936263.1 protein-L-isoaspartate O-methyltransferase [Nitrososphaerota archaeon]MDG6944485.1 protein-L-isoaspartate O-methyltransferase [Nitrososphaerota archaeon]
MNGLPDNESMVNEIIEMGLIKSNRVKNAFMSVDRGRFVFPGFERYAYFDEPLPLGESGQTISAPSMLGIMLEVMRIERWHYVLEIGTGSGYSAALISRIADFGGVVSVEHNYNLFKFGKNNLREFSNVLPVFGDGTAGYPPFSQKPQYDRIVIMASTNTIPDILLTQLMNDGFVVAPIGPRNYQELVRVWKNGKVEKYGGCIFVPLKYGFD